MPRVRAAAALGVLGAWALLLVALCFVVVSGWEQLSGVWELQTGVIGLAPAWLLLTAAPGALGGLVALWLLTALVADSTRTSWSLSGVVFAFFAAVGWGVGGGRHLASLAARGGFAFTVGCVFGVLSLLLLPRLISFLQGERGGTRLLLVAGSAGCMAFVLEAMNFLLLVRLYPAFHIALTFLSLFLGGLSLVLARVEIKKPEEGPAVSGFYSHREPSALRPSVIFVSVSLAISLLLLLPASRAVAGFDNFRWMMQEGLPSLAWGVDLAAKVAPSPALEEGDDGLALGARRRAGNLDLRDRDILLISVDALRADHLGAYGYERATSKEMDALAKEGTLFEAAYAPTPHTSYSVTSLMTGKYMRPLLLQGAGADSDVWASLLRSYDYRTAGFYPPAIFYIDTPRFESFRSTGLGFEYTKVEFAEGDVRVGQVERYLKKSTSGRRLFLWVHLFGPHEPYEKQAKYEFGERDIDLYDGEIAAADETVGRLVRLVRARDPRTLIILTADHGEEFGDHGGRYHGTTVFDEQVRVPLIIAGEGLAAGRRIKQPVQTIDLLPTVLDGLRIPLPPRIRGRSLSHFLEKKALEEDSDEGRALSETDDYTLLAEGPYRLICQRRSGACQLFNIESDPGQKHDVSVTQPQVVQRLRTAARKLAESHGKYESQGLRAEGKGWPTAIVLGISGDASVAPTLATLLDDADVGIRSKAAELLFELATDDQAPALRLALTREENDKARAWIALALTRLGQGAPLVVEILAGPDLKMRRLAALALAEHGDDTGEKILLRWWAQSEKLELDLAKRLLAAFARLRSEDAVNLLIRSLKDERLRPTVAHTLAQIGDRDARPFLVRYLMKERYHSARLPLAQAIVDLGGDDDLIVPLRRFLGVPDGMPGAMALARKAKILSDLGGPKELERRRLRQLSDSGVKLTLVIPPAPKSSKRVRLIVRCRSHSGAGGTILIQPGIPRVPLKKGQVRARSQPAISTSDALALKVPPAEEGDATSGEEPTFVEVMVDLPTNFRAKPGHHLALEIFAPQDIEIADIVAVPRRKDLPPPAPEEWGGEEKGTD